MARQLFCQVCRLFLEDEDGNRPAGVLRPSILRESSDEHSLETPRAITYQLRLALARERLSAEASNHSQDFLDDLRGKDDRDAVSLLWLFLGGLEGDIADPT